jgi:hypothetical protein
MKAVVIALATIVALTCACLLAGTRKRRRPACSVTGADGEQKKKAAEAEKALPVRARQDPGQEVRPLGATCVDEAGIVLPEHAAMRHTRDPPDGDAFSESAQSDKVMRSFTQRGSKTK